MRRIVPCPITCKPVVHKLSEHFGDKRVSEKFVIISQQQKTPLFCLQMAGADHPSAPAVLLFEEHCAAGLRYSVISVWEGKTMQNDIHTTDRAGMSVIGPVSALIAGLLLFGVFVYGATSTEEGAQETQSAQQQQAAPRAPATQPAETTGQAPR